MNNMWHNVYRNVWYQFTDSQNQWNWNKVWSKTLQSDSSTSNFWEPDKEGNCESWPSVTMNLTAQTMKEESQRAWGKSMMLIHTHSQDIHCRVGALETSSEQLGNKKNQASISDNLEVKQISENIVFKLCAKRLFLAYISI